MKKKSTTTSHTVDAPSPENFEVACTELEHIVTTLEAGQMQLENALSAYKRGAELLQYCQTVLKDSQQQVKILETDLLKNFSPSEHNES